LKKNILYIFLVNLSLLVSTISAMAQVKSDSLNVSQPDTLQTDTVGFKTKSQFDIAVKYKSTDSISFNVLTQKIILYGDAEVQYGDIELKSDNIDLDWKKNILIGKGTELPNGDLKGTPIFSDKGKPYKAEEIKYNFKTEKAIVKKINTQEGEGYVHGEQVKIDKKRDLLYIKNGLYTTCEADHPHYGIRAKQIKMIGNEQIVTGGFNLELNDVKTPFGLPFAMVPIPNKRVSGLLLPSYGESRDLGFFLRDGGFYWAISDKIDMTFLGEIYSRGGYGGTISSTYKRRYHHSGRFNFRFNNRPTGEEGTINRSIQKDFFLTWSHNPVQRGASRFSASVNAGTSTANKNFSRNTQDFLATSFSSSVAYSHSMPNTPFNFSASLRHNQNVETDVVTVSPQLSLNMNRLYPLKQLIKSRKRSLDPLRQLGVSYKFNAKTDFSNNIKATQDRFTNEELTAADTIGFNISNADLILKNAKLGGKHDVSLSTSATIFKYFNLSPSFNYSEVWMKEKYKYRYDPDNLNGNIADLPANDQHFRNAIDTTRGLTRAYSYNMSMSLGTRIYIFSYPKIFKKIQAIRHLITPSVAFSYNPNFQDPNKFSFYQRTFVGGGEVENISRFGDGAYNPSLGKNAGKISFGFTDIVEMKVQQDDDPENTKKISLLEEFSIKSGYDIAKDSFNLDDISITARTTLFGKLSINTSMTIDPYTYELLSLTEDGEVTQIQKNAFAWQTGNGLGSLSRASVTLNTSLNPAVFNSGGGNPAATSEADRDAPQSEQDAANMNDINQNRSQYVDFNIPWNLTLSFNFVYTKTGFKEAAITNTMNFNGDFNLTENWKVTYTSGYDFQAKGLSRTNIGIHRNLHCWQMSVDWTPFGPQQSYSFELGIKAAILQDLKLNRRNNWYDRAPQ
jgi:lipopolysaccharide assembly outer membrane protein LptD (OstA)